ncbi:aminodeoxychorismate synthase component I [Sulfitobacter mediterraneus]|uniref:Para-aminobenzoate synthetase component 1 n=1 Tax=Sulfitobacter mediterraneus TaxID=83219 RepID=A0A2T6CBB8_9RHOB|nr:aminodeoxychorismate synthase component I [Sulfitobacter mediterraneus]KIN76982.1 Para-aminobenzoate synthase component I [Sulfitobacter mediterraneus KCTC 32188]PTX72791.1 para-aminobenzoate synthetase component 1 [Sulfitobacter mediterraneus]
MTQDKLTASVLFDRGPLGSGSLFRDPEDIIEAWYPDEVGPALQAMEAAQQAGKWLAGSASYELGYALTPDIFRDHHTSADEPLLRFGVFDQVVAPTEVPADNAARLGTFTPEWCFETYKEAFDTVHDFLKSGDIYQANLTFPITATYEGCLRRLYERLRQKQSVPYGAFVDLGATKLLCRSPELFFSLSADGQLRARPMKGTIKRSADRTEDAALRAQLAGSEKDQAENLMITDLLRNDFARIAQIGSVQVPSLFEIESYATVHQMISEVTATIKPDCGLSDILLALFPCGSITGAPKIRAMQILARLETAPRDAYCGMIGWIAPDGAMEFNVAIRTLICGPTGQARLNVGGGVVYDSSAQSEYDEALLKSAFAQL